MGDERSLKEKLLAMANQSASPAEAEVARAMLETLAGAQARIESRRLSMREAILASPDRVIGPRRVVEVRFPSGQWVEMFEDEADWELIQTRRLPYRRDGSPDIITPTASARPPKLYD